MKSKTRKEWLTQIAALGNVKTPYVLTDLDVATQKVLAFKKVLPQVELYYAVKSNDDHRLLKTLSKVIEGFEIASAGELKALESVGVAPERTLFSNPVKINRHIEQAYRKGVRYFAIDSSGEVTKLKKYAPGSAVYLRIKVSDYGSKFPLSAKSGMDSADALDLAVLAQKAGLEVKGVAFHVGSQAETSEMWDMALKISGELIQKLQKLGMPIEFLDIGGGFPAQYEEAVPSMQSIAKVINKGLEEHIPDTLRIVAEPGRYISANASVMVSTVIGREFRSGAEWLYLDVGVFQGLIEALEIGFKYPIITKKRVSGPMKSFVLTGPSCDPYDTIGLDYTLPSNIKIGDQLCIDATGAYTLVYASNFNGFDIPKAYYTKSGTRA